MSGKTHLHRDVVPASQLIHKSGLQQETTGVFLIGDCGGWWLKDPLSEMRCLG